MSDGRQVGKPAPPAAIRWSVLLLVSVAMFGNYYVYDSIAPLADILKNQLGFTSTQIGTLNAIYSFPNIVMVLIGGVIVDRIGTRTATLVFVAICLVGAVTTALSGTFVVMAVGRLIFGLGAESMIVAVTAALGQWFKGKQLGFAFGLNLSVARAGSYAADLSPVWAKSAYASGWRTPMLIAAAFCGIALVGALVYWILERSAEPRYELNRPQPPDRVVWSDLWRFDRSFWYVVGLCVTFYSVIFPFRSTFAIEYFQNARGLSLEQAGAMNGHVFLAAIFATPLFGLLVDRLARRSAFMAFGSLLLMSRVPDPDLDDLELVDLDRADGRCVLARAGRPLALGSVSGRRAPPRHGLRPHDDGPEHRPHRVQPGRGRAERQVRRGRGQPRSDTSRCC